MWAHLTVNTMMKNNKIIILVSKGYILKSGYYFRCIRDKELLENLGYVVDIVLLSNSKFRGLHLSDSIPLYRIDKIAKLISQFNLVMCENIGVSTAVNLLSILNPFSQLKKMLVYHGSLAELKHDRLSPIKSALYKFNEWFSVKYFDGIVVVSDAFKDILVKEYGNVISKKIITVPNYPNDDFLKEISIVKMKPKNDLKSELSLKKDFDIFTYAGNIQPWQNLDYIIDIFYEIYQLENKSYFVFLSKYESEIHKKINDRIPQDNYKITFVENSQIPKYLVASDYLIVIRKQDMINKVACPTKAIEYILSDTKIITSQNLGDISNYVTKSGKGVVIDSTKNAKINAEVIIKEKNIINDNHHFKKKEKVEKEFSKFLSNKLQV